MARIYTKTGDDGSTSLWGRERVPKDDVQVESYGTVDELNSVMGMMRSEEMSDRCAALLDQIQNDLFQIGAELAATPQNRQKLVTLAESQIEFLETAIDQFEVELAPLKMFILPGGNRLGATTHFARTVCRRAERCVVSLASTDDDAVSPGVIKYLNRLSDLLFVLARTFNQQAGCVEQPWVPRSPQSGVDNDDSTNE